MSSIISSGHREATRREYILDVEHYLGRIANIIARVAFILLVLRFFVFEYGVTDGISMEPTLRDNTSFIVEKISPIIFLLARGDIVQHIEPIRREKMFVKRVIGLPGETVSIKKNAVYITPPEGTEYRLNEPYLNPQAIIAVPYRARHEFRLADNEYFLLGDNRPSSNDSRTYGPIHRSLVTGKVFPIMLR